MKKKQFVILIIISIATGSFSQTPYNKLLPKDTMTWQHFSCFIPVMMKPNEATSFPYLFDQSVAAIDTITINSFIYKKIYNLNNYSINYNVKTLVGYMREDTIGRKVYFRESGISIEYLLYDFSLSVGDSTMLTFPNIPTYNGYYRADSIIIKNERCGPRKHFYLRKHLNNPNPNFNYLDHIESIGSNYHVLYLGNTSLNYGCQLGNFGTCKWPGWTIGLSCKNNDQVKQYQSCTYIQAQMNYCLSPVDSCNYRNICSNIKTSESAFSIFNIFPNPVNDHLKIDFNSDLSGKINIKILDLTGRIILIREELNKNNSIDHLEINTETLEKGIYFIQVEINKRVSVREFAISR